MKLPPNQSPERTATVAAVAIPPRVGGGSAFYVSPLDHHMSKRIKQVLLFGVSLVILLVAIVALSPDTRAFFAMQADGIRNAGTWEDDPRNWFRAFGEEQPTQVKVVHSKYWRSNHFTKEFIYYFEVEATTEWRDAFLTKRELTQVHPSVARSFRMNTHSDDIPGWFAPDPVELYDVWDKAGYFGSIWINKTNGHIYFYDAEL